MMTSRTLSMPVCVAASISRTSMSRPSAISTHASHVAARIGRRPVHAVQRPRQDARRRRLADAARSGEHERLREPAARQRVAQRPRHRLLSDDVVELLRPPLARDDLVGHFRVQSSDFGLQMALRTEPRPGGACGTCQDLLSAAAFRP